MSDESLQRYLFVNVIWKMIDMIAEKKIIVYLQPVAITVNRFRLVREHKLSTISIDLVTAF